MACCQDVSVSDILRQPLFLKHRAMIDKVTKRENQIYINGTQKREAFLCLRKGIDKG